jgi:hypothetical protein
MDAVVAIVATVVTGSGDVLAIAPCSCRQSRPNQLTACNSVHSAAGKAGSAFRTAEHPADRVAVTTRHPVVVA